MVFLFVGSVFGQVFGVNCPTLAQQQAAYNQSLANKIVVINTSTQQLQTYYQQLATYYQQLDKTNQQLAKDQQQRQKDIQQAQKDEQQIAADNVLAERLAALQLPTQKYDELVAFIEVLMPLLGQCSTEVKLELVRIHTNRSGQADGTNPGGQTHNINGFDNPGWIISR